MKQTSLRGRLFFENTDVQRLQMLQFYMLDVHNIRIAIFILYENL